MSPFHSRIASAALCAALGAASFGCYPEPEGPNGGSGGTPGTGGVSGAGGNVLSGLPCDVARLLSSRCVSCHGQTPSGGASNSLLTAEDLKKPSSVAGKNQAEQALVRMADNANPMPPGLSATVPSTESAALQAWISAGYPAGECGGGDGGVLDPYDTPDVCTSNAVWTRGENEKMRPGEACIACHQTENGAPSYTFSGTVYPTAHEPDRCNGVALTTGVQVIIIDKNGVSHPLSLLTRGGTTAGNFGTEANFPTPYTAKVTYQGRERVMTTPQTEGDCNACHTLRGAQNAPGRIMLP